MKQYIGISRDHSGSMSSIARAAAQDYNQTIAGIKEAAHENVVDTIVSVVECGVDSQYGTSPSGKKWVNRIIVNSDVRVLQPLAPHEYKTPGGTPLWDSVGDLIEQLTSVPDYNNPEVSFIIMAITDGQEMHSTKWNANALAAKIRELQATDRWTFVFRVPKGYGRAIASKLNLNDGNILEWETSTRGMEQSTVATAAAFTSFYQGRTKGVTATRSFYSADLKVSKEEVKAALVDISKEVKIWGVTVPEQIRDFVNNQISPKTLLKGAAFYQLTKKEDEVQDYKMIAVQDRKTGAVYGGAAARELIGLPSYGTVKVQPGNTGDYDVFIQSTSVNRKLIPGTKVLYWEGAAN